ncbi:amino acid adenylation domain-containing protein [Undibacterium sp. TJN19]|uniref:amino acid adenylation domain-containing protein n=1 Tax=Undibacterium sp. TJN19 TaxID=3413055 RepID=UPI003BF15EBC
MLAGQGTAVLVGEEIGRADRDLPLPLSFAQQRLWFFGQLEGASAAYHMSVALRLQGTLDVAALQAALDTIIERHEALRTIFVSVEDNPVQVISEDAHFPLQLVDLSNWVVTEREAEVNRQVGEETHNRFDLGTGPLIRGRLIKLASDEHVLSIAIHHIVSDGWSIGILLREIAVLYGAYQQGLVNPLPRLPVQYADYAVWQRAWLQGEVLENQSAYWKQKLACAPALLELPTDRVRPPVQSYQGGSVSLALGAELSSQLRALSRKNGTTLFMTLYAGLSILLSRLSGQDDVVIGTPIANRNRAELEGLIGFFVNTLALRTQLNDKMSVSELLKQVKETTLSAYSHQDLPFEQVVEAIQPVRSLSSSAVFQVMLVLDNTPQSTQSLPGLNFAPQGMSNDTEQFDLSLSLQEAGDQIVGAFSYASDLFDRATVARWTEHFRQVLTAMVQDDAQTLGAIDMLRPEERQQIVVGFNAAKTDFPQDEVIQQWFEAQVEKTPDAIAIVFEEKYLTYAELNCRANQVARYLREQGVRPDQLVGISLEASLEVVVAMLGVLKSGAAYLPLDPSYPADRLAYMLQDASPVMVLTQAKLVSTLPASNAKVLTLDQGWTEIAKYGRANLEAGELGLSSSHLAYVIYTSGSTGKPKGVMIEHRQLVSLVGALQRTYALDANDRVLQFAALSFDMSVEEYFGSLCSGSTLTLRTDAWLGGGSVFWQHCINAGITILNLPTAFWHQLVIESHIPVPEAIRQIMIGGEKVSAEFVARWFLREGHLPRLVNAYGPTEATVDAAICVITDAVVSSRLIGRPLPNTCIYILDSHGAAVPIGVTGEVYIGGAGVARGYLNRPRLTAERFILDTFSDKPGARLYQTGDLGRFKADGNIEYLGRNDHQVKIRGFRIELGEIELQLSRHPSVKEAVVIAREDIPGEKRLVAYLIQDEAFAASEVANIEELRTHLKSALPDYMVPAAFVRLRVLPLTPNGKLDRKALPAPEMDAFAAKIYEAPQGETEVILAGIWQDLLHVERVGRNDNFFELGGHSLLAVQLMTHIRQGLGREVTLRQLFEYPTVHALSLHLTSARAISIAAIEPADRSQPLLLSWAQQRLWFIDQLDGGGAAYHMPDALRLSGRLDRAALQSALNAMVERHEALRTVFSQAGGYPTQVVLSDVQFPLPLIDLEHCEAEEREALVKRHTAEEAVARFDLSTGPLIRGRLLCLSDEEHVLLITTHHIVSDGWSESILMEELAEFYSANRDDRPHRLPALPIQYPDYAAWQRQWLQGDILQNQLDYWKNHLGGAPALLELPTDRVRPADQNHRGGSVVFTLDQQLTRQLNDFTRQHDATLFITLYTGFAILLSGLSGQDDVVIGTPTANRQRTEVEGLIGFFVNTLALRADLSDNPSVRNLIRQIKFMTLDAYSHQDLPFEQVVDALQPPRSLRHSPLFQVMLVLQNNAQSDFNLPGLTVAPHDIPYDIEQFDMTLSMREVDGYLVGSFSYVTDLFDRSTIERWVGYFKNVLAAMVDDAEQGVKSIDVLDDEERHRLVLDLNATEMDFPEQKSLHGLFEEQVEKTPDAIALVRDGQRISYRELNRRANRVAHTLLARGVTAEACVGICLPRTAECIVSLLGVLKAGACYVPIDPAYPASRVEYLLGDADMAALITTAALQDSLDIDAAKALCVDDHNAWQDRFDNPGFAVSSRQLAYVIYTSGSTGRPKGVPLSHQGGVSLLHWACSMLPESDRTGILAGTSLCFDLSIYELFLPLTTGHTCILIDNILALENLDEASRQQITLINTVPSAAKALLDRQTFPPSVRVLNLAGEPLRANLVDRLYAETGIGHVYDLYGPSEGTTYSSFALRQSRATETIGRPVANNQFYVLSKEGQLVPQGVIGELYIGGVGLARGYLQRPGLTAEKFVPNRFSTTAGDRLYLTGDLVRYRANGDLEYLGRADHQVKVRGFRIELGEIESACLQHSGIKDAVVIVREDNPDNRQIVAYVVVKQEPVPGADTAPESLLAITEMTTSDGVDADAVAETETETDAENDTQLLLIDSLKARLKQVLPGFMMPSAFVILPEIPLTPNGKLDRKALPAPDGSDAVQGYVAPEGDVETRIAAVWEDILKRTQIGRYDNFFDLGGHSLIAVVAVSRMRQVGLNIALDAFFKHPTVKTMAEFIMFGDETRLWMGGAVVMREQGEQRPLFLVHEITGDIFPLFPLSRYLREGIPVYGLPLTKESCRDSVPGLAAQHLQAIRKIQPKGPYRVAGHSFGGVLSYEIATQIVASGEEVEFLGLIDTYRPYFKQGWADEVTDLKVLLIYVEILHPGLAAERWAILHAAKTAAEALEQCKLMGLFPEELGLTEVLRWADNMSSILVMGANYEPKPLAVPTYQFTAEAEALGDRDWSPLIGDSLHVIHVGGTHLGITQEPVVQTLALAMSQALPFTAPTPVDENQASPEGPAAVS